METLWDYIKELYKEKYNIPPEVIDYVSVQPILKRCVTGYGNKSICYAVRENIDYVSQVIFQYLSFPGWTDDLDLNPLAIYNRYNGNYEYFKQEIQMFSPYFKEEIVKYAFDMCKKYKEIEKEIKEIYEKSD